MLKVVLRYRALTLFILSLIFTLIAISTTSYLQESQGRKRPKQVSELDMRREVEEALKQIKQANSNPLSSNFSDSNAPGQFDISNSIQRLIVEHRRGDTSKELLSVLGDHFFSLKSFYRAYYYYNQIKPKDLESLEKSASSLIMLGKNREATKTLQEILSQDPNSFKANAYMAIALTGSTDSSINEQEAGKYLEKAIQLAPNPEAASRLNQLTNRNQLTNKQVTTSPLEPGSEFSNLSKFLHEHPVVSDKFVGLKLNELGELDILFINFPIQVMPENMKNSFIAKIKLQIAKKGIKVNLVDQTTKKVMENFIAD